ncbi:MAG TPA: hypothetical protein DCZ19_13885 [Porphyromonadaceae bacterium]|nr:MAG: hypothetical protein A2071_06670 [Bacteroidetes bacterium GWC1_47_7]HBB02143.1 hypothetical protein [Porphyromonadaceae bacterium]
MILFIIAMHSMTDLLVYENRQPNHLVIENDLKKCRRMIAKEGVDRNTKERYYSFPWGNIKVSIFPYKGDILLIHISSEIEDGQSTGYYFLHVNQE